MYNYSGWWFPDQDTHFAKMLGKSIAKGHQPVYQEPVRRASIKTCLHNKRTQVAIDIGANVGLWTRDLCKYFTQVLAVEPVEIFRDCLIKNVPAKNLTIYDCALGNVNSWINMIITPDNTGHTHVDLNTMGQGKIQMRTLDSMNFPGADYIKVDCESHEFRILQGGENYIKEFRPIIVIEQKFQPDTGITNPGEAVDLLRGWGAQVLKQIRHDLVLGW